MADKFELSENEIGQVLTIFPDIDRESIWKDLQITKSPVATINRILDGNFLIGETLPGPLRLSDNDSESDLPDICSNFNMDRNMPGCSSSLQNSWPGNSSCNSKIMDAVSAHIKESSNESLSKRKYKTTIHEVSSSDESNMDERNDSFILGGKKVASKAVSPDVSSEEDDNNEGNYQPLLQRLKTGGSVFGGLKAAKLGNNFDSEVIIDSKSKVHTLELSESDQEEMGMRTESCNIINSRNGPQRQLNMIKKNMTYKRKNIHLEKSSDCVGGSAQESIISKAAFHRHSDFNCMDKTTKLLMSSSEDEDIELPDLHSNGGFQDSADTASTDTCDVDIDLEDQSKKSNSKRTPKEIEESKKAALFRKEQRKKEREEKKQLREKEIAMRKAYKESKKAVLPGECIKYIKVILDSAVIEGSWGAEILTSLQKGGFCYIVESQPVRSSITWSRKVVEPKVHENDDVIAEMREAIEDEVVLLICIGDFVNLVYIFKQKKQGGDNLGESLRSYGQRMLDIFQGKRITFIVQGVEKYFRDLKTLQQRQFRAAISSDEDNHRVRKQRKVSDIDIVITRIDVEEALVDLHLHTNINVRLIETLAEVGNLVAAISKAIAEAPYKREKYKPQFSFLAEGSWAKGIKVDKDGKSLVKVWKEQIQQFHLVSPEIAATIVAAYPSPQLLLQAYKSCSSIKDAKNLLKELIIRRGTGVLATTRKVGPELSRKMYTLFTSKDGNVLINEK